VKIFNFNENNENHKVYPSVYVHAVFHFVSPLEIHNLYFGKHNKGDKSYKFMLRVANFHR
jgi:hypothetical protein